MKNFLSHFLPGLSQFGQSLWRSVVTVATLAVTVAPAGTFDNPQSAWAYLAPHWLGLVISSLVVPAYAGAKGTAQSISPQTKLP